MRFILPAILMLIIIAIGFFGISKAWERGSTKFEAFVGYSLLTISFISAPSCYRSFGEEEYVAAFAEYFVAYALTHGLPIVAFFVSCYIGVQVYNRTTSKFFGWAVGVVLLLVLNALSFIISVNIPGVDDRAEEILNSDVE